MATVKKNCESSEKVAAERVVKRPGKNKVVFRSDSRQTKFLKKACKRLSDQAMREARALGLETMYIENKIMYREQNGNRVIVGVIDNPYSGKYRKLKKGMILYVIK